MHHADSAQVIAAAGTASGLRLTVRVTALGELLLSTSVICSHSSAGYSVRLITERSTVRARVGAISACDCLPQAAQEILILATSVRESIGMILRRAR